MKTSWRILMLVFVAARKGAYWRALHLARHLTQHGHQVTVIAMSPQERWRLRVYEHHSLTLVEAPDLLWGAMRSGWDLWECLRRIAWLRHYRFDLVHLFDTRPTALFPGLYLKRRDAMPLIIDWEDWLGRGGSVEERPNPLIRFVLRPVETFFEEHFRTRADGTTVICTTLRDKAIQLGVPGANILLLRDGADVDGLCPLSRIGSRRELGLPVDAFIAGYVGAIFHHDAHLLAKAFDELYAQLPVARLLLIGYVNIPISKLVKNPQAVLTTGFISYSQMNRYLAACDLCLLPFCNSGANRGRWPMKLNDYMCVARPTVATAVGDVTEVMQNYAIGLLAQDNSEDLARQMFWLWQHPEQAEILGKQARQTAETVFDWRLRTAELEAFYGKFLS